MERRVVRQRDRTLVAVAAAGLFLALRQWPADARRALALLAIAFSIGFIVELALGIPTSGTESGGTIGGIVAGF